MPHSPAPLNGRLAVVTGAAGGIGTACVMALRQAGAEVLALDRDAAALELLVADVDCSALAVDLLDENDYQRLPTNADILVNNAGYQHVASIPDLSARVFAEMIELMLTAPFRLIQASLPHMYRQRWGRIINITSVHGHRASANKAAYVSAKHGLEGLSKVVALEGGAHGVTSNTVAPGYVATSLLTNQVRVQASANGIDESEVLQHVFLRDTSIKRLIDPSEVAQVVSFLCSDAASYINGASINIDGGWTAR